MKSSARRQHDLLTVGFRGSGYRLQHVGKTRLHATVYAITIILVEIDDFTPKLTSKNFSHYYNFLSCASLLEGINSYAKTFAAPARITHHAPARPSSGRMKSSSLAIDLAHPPSTGHGLMTVWPPVTCSRRHAAKHRTGWVFLAYYRAVVFQNQFVLNWYL